MVALWLFVSDHDVLSLQRYKHGEDVVEGKLVVIPGMLNAPTIRLAHFIWTGRQCPDCAVVGTAVAMRTRLATSPL